MRSFELRLSQGITRLSLMLCLVFAASPLYAADSDATTAAPAVAGAPASATTAAPAATASTKVPSRDLEDTNVRVYELDQKSVAPTTVPDPKSDLKRIAVESRAHSGAPLSEGNKFTQMSGKMWRGVNNIVFGWVEIPKTLIVESIETNPFSGLLYGVTIGTTKGFERTYIGALEVVTFWHNWPKDYAPIIEPAHVLDDVTN
jgi:putative exosortase-associated protein (TIGR04073 family)